MKPKDKNTLFDKKLIKIQANCTKIAEQGINALMTEIEDAIQKEFLDKTEEDALMSVSLLFGLIGIYLLDWCSSIDQSLNNPEDKAVQGLISGIATQKAIIDALAIQDSKELGTIPLQIPDFINDEK